MRRQVLTIQEVAALLGVSRDTVYRLAARGELPGRKTGLIWRFSNEAIQGYLSEGRTHDAEARSVR